LCAYPSEKMQGEIENDCVVAKESFSPGSKRPYSSVANSQYDGNVDRVHLDPEISTTNWDDVPRDLGYTWERFDLGRWWVKEKNSYPHLYTAAMVILAKPITNAFQERTFSIGTWHDTLLNQRTHESTFEMRVLDSLNANMVEEYKKSKKKAISGGNQKKYDIDNVDHEYWENRKKEIVDQIRAFLDNSSNGLLSENGSTMGNVQSGLLDDSRSSHEDGGEESCPLVTMVQYSSTIQEEISPASDSQHHGGENINDNASESNDMDEILHALLELGND